MPAPLDSYALGWLGLHQAALHLACPVGHLAALRRITRSVPAVEAAFERSHVLVTPFLQ